MQPELVLTSDFFLSFIKLITIHGVPRSRELIIHVTIRVRQRIWSKQHVGQCVGQNVGRHLSPVGILSQKVYLGEDIFFCCILKLTYQKCSFTFPLLLIQRKTGPFFSFMWQTSQLSGILRTQTLLMNFYSLRLLFKNKGSTHLDFKATVRTKYSLFATKDNLQKSGNDSRMMATKNVTGGGTQTKTFQRLLCSPLWVGESKQQSL